MDWDIYGRRVSAAGSPIGQQFAVATAPEFQSSAALSANTTSAEVLIVWQDFRHGSWDVYGQLWQPPPPPKLLYLPLVLKAASP